MTVLEKKAASGIEARGLARYVGTALVAAAIGVASVLGVNALVGDETFAPAEIEQARATLLADHLQNQWIAEVNATRAADLVEFYRGPFMARVESIQQQRAADMVEHFTKAHQGALNEINEQRAKDMVEYRYGTGR